MIEFPKHTITSVIIICLIIQTVHSYEYDCMDELKACYDLHVRYYYQKNNDPRYRHHDLYCDEIYILILCKRVALTPTLEYLNDVSKHYTC